MFNRSVTAAILTLALVASSANAEAAKQRKSAPSLDFVGATAPFGLSSHLELTTTSFDEIAPDDVLVAEVSQPVEVASPVTEDAAPEAPLASTAPEIVAPPMRAPAPAPVRGSQPIGFFADLGDDMISSPSEDTPAAQPNTDDVALAPSDVEQPVPDALALPRQRDDRLAAIIRAHSRPRAAATTVAEARSPAEQTAEDGPKLTFKLRR